MPLISAIEAAKRMALHPATIYKLCYRNELPHEQHGKRYFLPSEMIDELVRTGAVRRQGERFKRYPPI